MDKTDKELLQLKAVELAKIEQALKAKPELTGLEKETLSAIVLMSGYYRGVIDGYNKLIDKLRLEYQ